MDIRIVPINAVRPDPENVRKHDSKNLSAILESLAQFGQQKPIVILPNGEIIAGSGTWSCAKKLGWSEIAVQVTALPKEKAKAYAVADNRTAELGAWYEDELAATLRYFQELEMPMPGWEQEDLDRLFGTPKAVTATDEEPDWDAPETLQARYGVEPGQLWQLGMHRILCGDSRDPAQLALLLGDQIPQMVFADPPYGVAILGSRGWVGGGESHQIPFGGVEKQQKTKIRGKHGAAGSTQALSRRKKTLGSPNIADVGKYDPVIGDDSTDTAVSTSRLLLHTYPNAVHVWWGGNYYANHLPASSCWLIWNKETSADFADCELAWTNQPRAARLLTHRWNGMLRDSERGRRWHPTQKPAALAAWVYGLFGSRGDLILDPFIGCGPSLVAAQQMGSRCVYGLELSPAYVAVCLDRWHTLTGQEPHLLTTSLCGDQSSPSAQEVS